ncbi:MAG: transketolase [Candidatus Sumerlaeia bacterium]
MQDQEKQILQQVAHTIRGLSADAVDRANSGHPGLPLGCAEIGAYLYGKTMRHNPDDPKWPGRDHFVLSAGHGSMLLYSCLHLSGYDLSLEDLKNFRQLESPTPGHPEYGEAPGVETTTGPLGQGLANGVGIALANKMSAAQLGASELLDGQVFVLAGDGCMMEGITNEAASLAGHLKLDNLTVIYDSNDICLDGPTKETFTEDTPARYKALGWHVETIDGNDLDQVEQAIEAARGRTGQPTLIEAKTVIGKYAPQSQGTSDAHGSPLGQDETKAMKKAIGFPEDELFYVPAEVSKYMSDHKCALLKGVEEWKSRFDEWAKANADKAKMWDCFINKTMPEDLDKQIRELDVKPDQAGRKGSNAVLQLLHDIVPFLVGGSADLSGSDNTMMKASGLVSSSDYSQRNIKYGVREFAMGAINTGIALQGMFLPFCGTFMTFSDYMRNAIRLAALTNVKVVYQFTHDSIFLGEDGPTHQPVEHLAALRAIPNLLVFRPADTNEVKAAWSVILREAVGPSMLALTRQGLKDLEETNVPTAEGVGKGGYILKKESKDGQIDYCLMASGSEVALALDVAKELEGEGKSVRVVSMPCMEIFDRQSPEYQDSVLGEGVGQYWSIEAGVSMPWYKYIGRNGHTVCVNSFGRSAPAKEVARTFGFTKEQIVTRIKTTK